MFVNSSNKSCKSGSSSCIPRSSLESNSILLLEIWLFKCSLHETLSVGSCFISLLSGKLKPELASPPLAWAVPIKLPSFPGVPGPIVTEPCRVWLCPLLSWCPLWPIARPPSSTLILLISIWKVPSEMPLGLSLLTGEAFPSSFLFMEPCKAIRVRFLCSLDALGPAGWSLSQVLGARLLSCCCCCC